MKTYVPDTSSRIVHYTSVDFTKRTVQTPIHLVQYDSSLPIIAITLMEGTNAYSLPADGVAELRYGKNDYTFVIADALGQSADGTIVYFEITYQMTVESGEHHPVVSIWVDDKIAASSTINIMIDRNPVQNEQISSLTDYTALRRFRNEAKEAAESAKTSADNAKSSEETAKKAAEEASKNVTQTSKDAAQTKSDRETIEKIISNFGNDGLVYTKADALPEKGIDHRTIYLIPAKDAYDGNIYEEWLWTTDDKWEQFGTVMHDIDKKIFSVTTTLSKDKWSKVTNSDGNEMYQQDAVITGATETNFIVIGPDNTDKVSREIYSQNTIQPISQSSNKVTFEGSSIPENDIKIAALVQNNSI